MRVRFTPQADRQYLEALRYIRSKNPTGAATVMRRAEVVIAQLRAQPDSGHAIPEYPDLPHRELPVPPYRFFHRVVGDTVWITAVWHSRQLPEQPDSETRC
jgi:plasmid stabilization system protein ParE